MNCIEFASLIKDIAVAIAAIVTGSVAVWGINSWRREIQGKASFETARALISATYKLRNEIAFCRSPYIRAHEFPEGYESMKAGTNAQENARAWAFVYTNRFRPVIEAAQSFDERALEGEVLWGESCRSATEKFQACVRELNAAHEAKIENEARNNEDFTADRELGKRIRAIAFSSSSDNAFSKQIAEAVSGIEAEIRPYLRRS